MRTATARHLQIPELCNGRDYMRRVTELTTGDFVHLILSKATYLRRAHSTRSNCFEQPLNLSNSVSAITRAKYENRSNIFLALVTLMRSSFRVIIELPSREEESAVKLSTKVIFRNNWNV